MGLKRLIRIESSRWWQVNCRTAAVVALLYSVVTSILVTLFSCWRIVANEYLTLHLGPLYYGVQIAYSAILVTHVIMVLLSGVSILAVYQEKDTVLTPWILAMVTFMAMEGICCVYSNVLRDHINKKFDSLCKAEMTFFISRVFCNILAISAVLKYYGSLRSGFTYKDPEMTHL